MKFKTTLLFILTISLVFTSCKTKNLFKTSNHIDVSNLIHSDSFFIAEKIKTDDKISISIWNHDDMSFGSAFSIYNSNESFGKWILVNNEGYVNLPKIGNIKLAGYSCDEAKTILKEKYKTYLVNPIIVVKVLNRQVTILGEVRTPGIYILEKEKNSLSELIGRSEGFATYADLEKIQIIRNGNSYIIDMTQLDLYKSCDLIVRSNDIIHVPSKKGKKLDQQAPTIIPFASIVTSVGIILTVILN